MYVKQYFSHACVSNALLCIFCTPSIQNPKGCLVQKVSFGNTCLLRVTAIMQLFLSVKLTITFERSISVQEALTCGLCFFCYVNICSNPFSPGLRIRIHLIRIRIQHFSLNTDPDPGVLMTKNCKKIYSWNFLYIKNYNLPIPRPP